MLELHMKQGGNYRRIDCESVRSSAGDFVTTQGGRERSFQHENEAGMFVQSSFLFEKNHIAASRAAPDGTIRGCEKLVM